MISSFSTQRAGRPDPSHRLRAQCHRRGRHPLSRENCARTCMILGPECGSARAIASHMAHAELFDHLASASSCVLGLRQRGSVGLSASGQLDGFRGFAQSTASSPFLPRQTRPLACLLRPMHLPTHLHSLRRVTPQFVTPAPPTREARLRLLHASLVLVKACALPASGGVTPLPNLPKGRPQSDRPSFGRSAAATPARQYTAACSNPR